MEDCNELRCRLCLKNGEGYLYIFDEEEAVHHLIEYTLDIEVDISEKEYPMNICAECHAKLKEFADFKISCRVSQKQLKLEHDKRNKIKRNYKRKMMPPTKPTIIKQQKKQPTNQKKTDKNKIISQHSKANSQQNIVIFQLSKDFSPQNNVSSAQNIGKSHPQQNHSNNENSQQNKEYKPSLQQCKDISQVSLQLSRGGEITGENDINSGEIDINSGENDIISGENDIIYGENDIISGENYIITEEVEIIYEKNEEQPQQTIASHQQIENTSQKNKNIFQIQKDISKQDIVRFQLSEDFDNYNNVTSEQSKHISHQKKVVSQENEEITQKSVQFLSDYQLLTAMTKTKMKKGRPGICKCSACDLLFANKEESMEHKKVCQYRNQLVICDVCGQNVKMRHITQHKLQHKKILDFVCDQCEYKTYSKELLKLHSRVHGGVRTYACEYCSATFIYSSNLCKHRRRHLQKNLKCQYCERRFVDHSDLRRHEKEAHHNAHIVFQCTMCEKTYANRKQQRKHERKYHNAPALRSGKVPTYIAHQMATMQDINIEHGYSAMF